MKTIKTATDSIDTPEFRARLADLYAAYDESIELGVSDPNDRAISKLIAYIAARPDVGMVAAPLTPLQREIAQDAESFEAFIGRAPERQSSTTYPWGWRYVDDMVQQKFKNHVTKAKPSAPDVSVRDARGEALEEAAAHVEGMIDSIGDRAAYDNREMYDSEMMTMHEHTRIAAAIRALRAPIGADQGAK